jgi:hypothetical protein
MPTTKSDLLYEQLLAMGAKLPNEGRFLFQMLLKELVRTLKSDARKKKLKVTREGQEKIQKGGSDNGTKKI